MKHTSLYLKLAPKHAAKRKRAAAYKRTFGGICGGLTWPELARMVPGLEVGGASAPVKPRESFVGMLARIGRNLTRRAAR